MTLDDLLPRLFPEGHQVAVDDWFVSGTATVGGRTVAVLGTTQGALIGIRECVRLAEALLDIVDHQPGRDIVMLVDNQGQRMALDEELLCLPEYIGHLVQCQQLAREQGRKLAAIVYGNSIAGGFLAYGMEADWIFATEGAHTSVMKLEAIARVTKQPLEKLEELAKTVSVFAPGTGNFLKMGGLYDLWNGDEGAHLASVLAQDAPGDVRALMGEQRGGRLAAKSVIESVTHG